MKKPLRYWAVAVVGAAAALAFTSCAYDPYYATGGGGYTTVGGSYSSGYGDGYGYGGSGFSTSVFVGTGDPRWGYDPYTYSYYDYSRRSYYDPYLNGYYPIGYRPPIVYGVPHPYGYRNGYCPPPRYVHYGNVSNYRNREYAYRNSNYGWAKQVRQQPVSQGRVQDQHPSRDSYNTRQSGGSRSAASQSTYGRQNTNTGTRSSGNTPSRQNQGRSSSSQGVKPGTRETQGARLPEAYNKPVTRSSSGQYKSGQGNGKVQNQPRQSSQQNFQGGKQGGNRQPQGGSRQSQPAPQRGEKEGRKEEKRGVRGLGQG